MNKSIYLALGINLQGHKELLGLWIAQSEGAKFWLAVIIERQSRGVKETSLLAWMGLKAFRRLLLQSILKPKSSYALCIWVRKAMRFVSWKDDKGITTHLKSIYTINAIESLNSVIRHVTNKRKRFPSDDWARKIIYLAVMNASKKWTMATQNWCEAINWFMIEFDAGITAHL